MMWRKYYLMPASDVVTDLFLWKTYFFYTEVVKNLNTSSLELYYRQ